jgi:hypothetical protein
VLDAQKDARCIGWWKNDGLWVISEAEVQKITQKRRLWLAINKKRLAI